MDLSLGTKISQKRVWIQAQDLRKTFNSLFTREKHTKGYLQKCGEGEIQGSFRVEKSHINPLQSYTRMSSSATHHSKHSHQNFWKNTGWDRSRGIYKPKERTNQ